MSAWYWEDATDVGGAEKAMNGGFWAALIVAIITSLVACLSFFGMPWGSCLRCCSSMLCAAHLLITG